MLTLLGIISYLLTIYSWVIIAQIILSLLISFNVVNTYNDFVGSLYKALNALTEPVYRPIRRVLPDTGAFDFAPMVVLIAITILTRFIIPGVASSLVPIPPM